MARRVTSTVGLRSQHGLVWVIEAEWMLLSGQPGPIYSLYHRDCSCSMVFGIIGTEWITLVWEKRSGQAIDRYHWVCSCDMVLGI